MSETIIKQFSEIYQFPQDNQYFRQKLYFSPLQIPKLRNNMKQLVKLFPHWQSFHYLIFFSQKLTNNDLDFINQFNLTTSLLTEEINRKLRSIPAQICHLHLIAFFSKNRCQVVMAFAKKMPFPEIILPKFDETTNEFLANRKKLADAIQKYDYNYQKKANIQTYFASFFQLTLKNLLGIKSDWKLLCDVQKNNNPRAYRNKKNLLSQALEIKYGVKDENEIYLFLWELFIPIYQEYRLANLKPEDKRKKWITPTASVFQETAQQFNQVKQVRTDILPLVKKSLDLNEVDVENLLKKCIKALRSYENSQDLQPISYEEMQENFGDSIKLSNDKKKETLLDSLIQKENQQEYQKMFYEIGWIEYILLEEMRSRIPHNMREAVLFLGYKDLSLQILTQEEIAQQIRVNGNNINRATIARFFMRFEQVFQQQLFTHINHKFSEKNWQKHDLIKLLIQEYLKNKLKKIINLILIANLFEHEKYQKFIRQEIDNNAISPLEFMIEKTKINYQQVATILAQFIFEKYTIDIHKNMNKLSQNIKKLIVT